MLNFLTAVVAFVAAGLWFYSSTKVQFKFGFDMDAENQKIADKAAKLNCWASIFTGLSVILN